MSSLDMFLISTPSVAAWLVSDVLTPSSDEAGWIGLNLSQKFSGMFWSCLRYTRPGFTPRDGGDDDLQPGSDTGVEIDLFDNDGGDTDLVDNDGGDTDFSGEKFDGYILAGDMSPLS